MERDLDPEVIKSTQISLGKYVKRPPLSEKLLKKPPFRFLHDIITTVLKTTGFFENLFDDEELISDNVKDRDSKISFLNKVIFVVCSTTGKQLSAKPSKIVAGQEPEKTNELLQCLAQALDDKLSSEKAVKQYKDSIKSSQTTETKTKEPVKPTKKTNDTKKLASRSNEKLTSQKNDTSRSTLKQDKEKSNDIKSKRKEGGTNKNETSSKKTPQTKPVKKNAKDQKEPQTEEKIQSDDKSLNLYEKEKQSEVKDKEKNSATRISKLQSQDSDGSLEKEELTDEKLNIASVSPIKTEDNQDKLNASYTITENDSNSLASSTDLLERSHINVVDNISLESHEKITPKTSDNQIHSHVDNNDNATLKSIEIDLNITDKFKADTSANKELENKIIDTDRHENTITSKFTMFNGNEAKIPRPASVRPSSVRPSSSRPGAPRMREKVDNLIKESDNLLIGKVNIIAENTQNEEEEDTSLIIMDRPESTTVSQDQQELQLSSNEHGHLVQQILDSQKELSQISGKTEIEWQFGAQKAREALNQDIEQLRFNIQALSRVANPLGKLLDHIQEDVEVMRQELQQWSNIYEGVNKEMLKQKTLNEDSLMPFHTKLKQLEGDIEEKHDKINDLKILIHKNAIRIEKLLTSGNVQ
ncbi:TRAF3-interacting protein 1-like [Anticarsia gemmatalis]|uniref:TRAF3-interacting protein 1-like n=1 Tax=Anticarsia gemmatalis TaxID=129554 RepID=UPI003F76E8C8